MMKRMLLILKMLIEMKMIREASIDKITESLKLTKRI